LCSPCFGKGKTNTFIKRKLLKKNCYHTIKIEFKKLCNKTWVNSIKADYTVAGDTISASQMFCKYYFYFVGQKCVKRNPVSTLKKWHIFGFYWIYKHISNTMSFIGIYDVAVLCIKSLFTKSNYYAKMYKQSTYYTYVQNIKISKHNS